MFSINEATLYGNIVNETEMFKGEGFVSCSFRIATNLTYKDKDGVNQTKTDYHNVIVFGKLAETITNHFKKGAPIWVRGNLTTRTWEEENVRRYKTEIIVKEFKFGVSCKKGNEEPINLEQQENHEG